MSYILNALNKAESERKREQSEDLDDFVSAGWDPYQEAPKGSASYKLAAVILVIAGLIFYGFYSLTNQHNLDTAALSEPQRALETFTDKNGQQSAAIENKPAIEEIVDDPVEQKPLLEELQLPDVTIAGHIFIRSGSAKNRIFIGENTYYAGDRIDSDWFIESINFDSLSIRSGTMSTEIPLR